MRATNRISAFACALAACLLSARMASADVTLVKTDGWELFTSGRVNGFLSYGFGDGNPPPATGENITAGGGLDVVYDGMPKTDAAGNPIQGTFQSMRVRSGFLPNVLGIGLRRQLTEWTTLKAYVSLWTTIETEGQRKTNLLTTDAREGYLQLEGPWGSFLAGRALDLFSRGATQNDFLYAHGFGLGFPGNIHTIGPTPGMIGFGVLAAFFSAGLVYATPSVGGLQLTVGIYDPTPLPGGYEATRYVRPEGELTYDLARGSLKLHLFGNGEAQSVYRSGSNNSAQAYGVGYGGRVEVGPIHLGVAGHYGKGLGLFYALESDEVSVSQNFELRTFDGYSALAQFVTARFDFNLGWGISRVFLLDSDNAPAGANVSVFKYQMGYSAGIVYHARSYLHFDLDGFRGDARWFGAPAFTAMGKAPERQTFNFINTGVTVTW